jgi:polyhydroxyalkanoate synthesis regulator phasin
MPGEDLFKRYLEIGASVLGMSRERAESIVKDLVASGEVARGQASKAADWLVERGRAGTEELAELVRREVRQQVAALGLATKDDLDALEARLAAGSTATVPPEAVAPKAVSPKVRKAAGTKKAAGSSQTAAGASRAGDGEGAGITRSGSVRRRPGTSGPGGPEPASPAGGAVPPKG